MVIRIIKKSQLYFIFSFALLIVLGALLLKTPWVMNSRVALDWSDALFTATSAVCVTGLTVVPTSEFNLGGQLIILLLIHLGGLGIMTLSATILLALGRNMSLGSTLIYSTLNESVPRRTEELLRTITYYTLVIEAVGSVVLIIGFLLSGQPFFQALYLGIFHAISAFCNAGFSPFDDSLTGVSSYIKIAVAALIIAGGLGMYVIYDLVHFRRQSRVLSINTRLILTATVILIIGGSIGIKFSENFASVEPISWLDAFFQAVSARTAGFNSVDLSALSQSSITLLIILMLIGAAPGSTAGGMKLTGVSLAAISIVNTFFGNQKVLLFKREIPISNVLKSYTIICTYILLTLIGALTLAGCCGDVMIASFFEAASAVGTVGLTVGTTEKLTLAGKLTVIALMFIGRIGPFTMFLFLLGREKKSALTYPEERVVIG